MASKARSWPAAASSTRGTWVRSRSGADGSRGVMATDPWTTVAPGRHAANRICVLRQQVDPAVRGVADRAERDDLALELTRRVAVHVGRIAHLRRVPQAAGLVDALEPRDPVEELRHEDDDELRPALTLRTAADVVVDARPSEQRALKGPAIAHALDVAIEL